MDLTDHIILNKQVALKVVTLHKIKNPYVSKNLKREPAIMAKMNHPNSVEVVSVGDFHCLVRLPCMHDSKAGGVRASFRGDPGRLLCSSMQVFVKFGGNDDQ